MKSETLYRLAAWGICICAAIFLLYVSAQYLFCIFVPFLIAYAVSSLIRPVSLWLNKKIGFPKRFGSAVLMILAVLLIGAGVFSLGNLLVGQVSGLITDITADLDSDDNIVRRVIAFFQDLRHRIPFIDRLSAEDGDRLADTVETMLRGFAEDAGVKMRTWLTNCAGGILSSLPRIIFSTVVTLLAAFYFTFDKNTITSALAVYIPDKAMPRLNRLKTNVGGALSGWIKAYFTITLVVFTELLVGFLLMNVKYSVALALLTAFVDLLPVLGVGTVLVPWAAVCFITGDMARGIGLLVLLTVMYIVRQIIEPKILGSRMGLHPAFVLFAVYAGFRLLGIFGMIIAPMIMFIIKAALADKQGG